MHITMRDYISNGIICNKIFFENSLNNHIAIVSGSLIDKLAIFVKSILYKQNKIEIYLF